MGLTFDTGALIGLERVHHSMRKVYDAAITHGVPITVQAVVVAEWSDAGDLELLRASVAQFNLVRIQTA
jgi:hypothetical protein